MLVSTTSPFVSMLPLYHLVPSAFAIMITKPQLQPQPLCLHIPNGLHVHQG